MAKQLNVNLSFNADTSKAKAQMQDLQRTLDTLVKGSAHGISQSGLPLTKDLMEAQVAATKLQTILSQSMNQKTGNLDLTRFSESFNKAGMDLQKLKTQLELLGPTGQKAFMSLASSIVSADVPLRRTNLLISELWTTMKNTARWQLSSSVLHGFMGTIQSATSYAKDLDKSLNNIRIVTEKSTDEMAAFAERANKAAKALSATTTQYTDASLIYYQQGLNDTEVQQRTDVTIKMAHAAGQSAEIVSDQLTAIWNNFYDGSKSLEYYADVMTALGAATASSTDEIAGGLEKFASIAEMIGLSYEYAASALATITATTRQSEEVVGTALKTIFARIQGLSLGETLDDGTTLNKYSEALMKVGISIKDQNGELKNMDSILNEMGAKWDTLNKDQQVALAQTVAGVRQYNQLVSLMDNWDFFEQNLNIAYGSTGTLEEQAEIYAESWQAARDRVKAAAQDIYDSILDPEFFIGLLDGFEDVLSMIATFTDSIGGLEGVFAGLGVIITRVFSSQLTDAIERMAFNFRSMTGETQRAAEAMQNLAVSEVNKMQFDTGTEAGDAEATALRRRLQLQNEIKAVSQNLTQEQREQLSDLLKINDAYAEQAIKAAQVKDIASDKVQNTSSQLRVQVKRTETSGTTQESRVKEFNAASLELKNIINEGAKAEVALSAINSKMNVKNAGNFGDELNRISKHLFDVGRTEASNTFGELKHSFEALVKSGKLTEKELDNFKIKLNEIVTSEGMLEDETIRGADAFRAALSSYGLTQEQVDKLANEMMELVQAERQSKDSADAATKAHNELKSSIQGFQGAMGGFGQSVVKAMQGVSQISMGITSLKSAWNALNNEDMSFGEKFLQITMSLSMAIPSLIGGFQALKAAKLGEAAATVKDTLATMADSIAKIQNARASGTAAVASSGLTKSLWGQFAAWLALRTSMSSAKILFISMVGPILAVVAAAAVLIGIGAKIYNDQNKTAIALNKANEALKESETAFNNASTAAQSFKNELSGYDEAVDKLKDTTLSTEELSKASEEASKKAKNLIETYKLFDEKYRTLDRFGNVQLSKEGRKHLDEISLEKDKAVNRAESVTYTAKINQTKASLDDEATNISKKISSQLSERGNYGVMEKSDVEKVAQTINTLRESMDGITPDVELLKAEIENNKDSYKDLYFVTNNLNDCINEDTIDSLINFADSLIESEQAIDYFNQKLFGKSVESAYGESFKDIADGDQQLYSLMNEVASQMLQNNDSELKNTQEDYQTKLSDIETSTTDDANYVKDGISSFLKNLFGDENFDAEAYLQKHYKEIFPNAKENYNSSITSADMAKAYLESQGVTVTSTQDQWGKITFSGIKDGQDFEQTFDNDMAQQNWLNQIGNYAIEQRMSELSLGVYSESEMSNVFQELKNKGTQYGANFTNNILSGFANKGEGQDLKFDFSNLFGELSETEVNKINKMDSSEIASLLGFDETELADLGGVSAEEFGKAFKKGLQDYTDDDFYKEEAAELGISADALENYTKNLQINNEELKENEDLAVKVAKAQIDLNRKVSTAAETFAKNEKILKTSNKGTEEFSTACGEVAVALNKVFGENAFDAQFVADELDLVKKAMQGDIEALAKLQDLAGERLLIEAGIDVKTEGLGKEINDWIGSQEFNELKIGATLDDSGMTEKFQELLNNGAITVNQMNDLLKGIGYEPDIQMVDVQVAGNTKSGQTAAVHGTIPRLQPDGTVVEEPFTTTIIADGDLTAGQTIQIPYIQGKGTTKVSAPKTMAKSAANGYKKGGGGGGGGKTSKAQPVKYTKQSDVVERYKEQNDILDNIEDELKDISKQSERAFGATRVAWMKKEQEALKKQHEAIKNKIALGKEYLKIDKEALKVAAKKYNLEFEFDANTGDVINQTQLMTQLYNELHAAEEAMDKLSTKEAQDKFNEETVTPIQNKIDELKDALAQYEGTKEELEDFEDLLNDTFYEWQDSNYNEMSYKLELKLEINDEHLRYLDYLMDKYSDNFFKTEEALVAMSNKIPAAEDALGKYTSYWGELNQKYEDGLISHDHYVQGLKEVRDGYYENLEALIEIDKQMLHYYEDTLADAKEELDDYTDHMGHLTEVFEHYINLMDILGKSKDFDAMNDFLNGKAETLRDRLDVAKDYYEMLLGQKSDAEKALNRALASGDEAAIELYKKEWDAIVDAVDEAQNEMLSLTEEWAEAMKAVIENNMAKIADALEKTLTGGTTFDTIMDEFDKLNTRQEEYLTKTNQIYETNKLMRTASKALDETDNKVSKQKLKNFIDETKSLQENTQLSKYELEIQQAKYDLLLAEIALEEAQNAKSTVRLSRDNEGNFGYVYTADQDAVDDAQQKVEDAENRLYNISLEGQQNYTEKYMQTLQEMFEELTELENAYINGELASDEEYYRRKETIMAHYFGDNGILTTYSKLYNVAVRTDAEATQDNWQKEYGEMTQDTEKWHDAVQIYLKEIEDQTEEWADVSKQANKDVEKALTDSADATEELTDESEELADMIQGDLIPAIDNELDMVREQTAAYAAQRKELLELIAAHEAYITSLNSQIQTHSEAIEYDPDTDYAALIMGYMAATGATKASMDDPIIKELVRQRDLKRKALNMGDDEWGGSGSGFLKDLTASNKYYEDEDEVRKALNKLGISSFDSGGYTGDWGPEGKLAILHEKELILNQNDTGNLLSAVSMIREIANVIDAQASMLSLFNLMASSGVNSNDQTLEQKVEIYAEFPNATNHNEIEEAFKNLINTASQYANRKN